MEAIAEKMTQKDWNNNTLNRTDKSSSVQWLKKSDNGDFESN